MNKYDLEFKAYMKCLSQIKHHKGSITVDVASGRNTYGESIFYRRRDIYIIYNNAILHRNIITLTFNVIGYYTNYSTLGLIPILGATDRTRTSHFCHKQLETYNGYVRLKNYSLFDYELLAHPENLAISKIYFH